MANTYPITFESKNLLSKVKLGNDVYYVKDADLRAIVAQFGNAADQSVAASIGAAVPGLATGIQVYEYVNQKTADLAGAMHFVSGTRAAQTNPKAGDVVIEGVIEYVYDGKAWQQLGDEGTWVPKTRTIAGLDLQDNITVAELKSALSLAALAYANTASVTVSDYATGITGASYTPAGTVSADVDTTATAATLTREAYKPAGAVTGTVVPTGEVSLAADSNGFQISGSNAASAVNFTPATESVLKSIKTAAVAPSFTEGAFTPGSFTKGSAVVAATEGVVAAIDSTDSEMLVFTNAATDNVMDYDASYVAPSKAADTFNAGSAAEFNTQAVWVTGTTAEAAAQVFTGGKIAATFTGNQFGDAIDAEFNGTQVADFRVTGVTYDKVSVDNFAFDGTAATITPTLNKGNKTITVTPDAVSSGS